MSDIASDFQDFYHDIDYNGDLDSSGNVKTYNDNTALAQALIVWMVSSKGEQLRTSSGGYLLPLLQKPMSPERVAFIKRALTKGLKEDFKPEIKIQSLSVIPDYQNRQWTITLVGYSPTISQAVALRQTINNLA